MESSELNPQVSVLRDKAQNSALQFQVTKIFNLGGFKW